MTTTKQDALGRMCHCGSAPGQPCWPNGNVHPDRHVTRRPGPRVQVYAQDSRQSLLYDSSHSDIDPQAFLAACADQPVRVVVKGRNGAMWSGTMVDEETP